MEKLHKELINETKKLCVEIGDTMFQMVLMRTDKVQYLTISQLKLLKLLEAKKTVKMKEIAEKLAIGPSGATYIVDGLLKEQLVERYRATDDRRVVCVGITQNGKKLVEEIRNIKGNFWKNKLESFTREEGEEFLKAIRILHRVVTSFREELFL